MNPPWRAAIAAALLLAGCRDAGKAAPTTKLLLPGLAAELATLHTLRLRTAGDVDAVTLVRRDGRWRVLEHAGWPADPALVDGLLQGLSQLRGAEAKTADPALYARLGLEPVASPDATGVEVSLTGAATARRLVVGNDARAGAGTFVRIGDEVGTWQADRLLLVPHQADAWLDHLVVDLPLARVAEVEVRPSDAPRFRLVHHADGFQLAVGDVLADADVANGEALSGVLGPFTLDAVARDDVAPAERELRVTGDDGFVVAVSAWRRDGQVWIRLRGDVDVARADAWAAQAGTKPVATVQARADALDARCAGYMFRMPAHAASVLMMGRESLYAGRP